MWGTSSAYAVVSGRMSLFSSIYMNSPCILLEWGRFQSSKNRKNRVLAVKKKRKMVGKLVYSGNVRSRLKLRKKSKKCKADHFWSCYSDFSIDFWRAKITNCDFKNFICEKSKKIVFWLWEKFKKCSKNSFFRESSQIG